MPGKRHPSARVTSIIPGDRLCRLLLLAVLLLGPALARPMSALAGAFAVTRFDDPPPNGCATNGCSLREAVIAANSNPGPDVITLGSGTYSLTIGGEDDNAQTGDIDITGDMTISGLSASATTIDAGYIDRVFEVLTGSVRIERVKIINGIAGGNGGAVSNRSNGVLTITGSIFTSNDANVGGAIMNDGTLTLIDSTARANTANNGGAIGNTGTLQVIGSAIISNTVSRPTGGDGGGIYNSGFLSAAAFMTITNSTISGNHASIDGGGIYTIAATVRLNNVSIANNIADSDSNGGGNGGGIAINPDSGMVFVQNSLIAANGDTGGQAPDCATSMLSSQLSSQGYNLIQNLTGCTIVGTTTGNISGQNPQIGPLRDNGGPTLTHALLNGSPAIDRGNPSGCKDSQGHTLTSDQRGYPRPPGRRCDIGAYEVVVFLRVYLPAIRR